MLLHNNIKFHSSTTRIDHELNCLLLSPFTCDVNFTVETHSVFPLVNFLPFSMLSRTTIFQIFELSSHCEIPSDSNNSHSVRCKKILISLESIGHVATLLEFKCRIDNFNTIIYSVRQKTKNAEAFI